MMSRHLVYRSFLWKPRPRRAGTSEKMSPTLPRKKAVCVLTGGLASVPGSRVSRGMPVPVPLVVSTTAHNVPGRTPGTHLSRPLSPLAPQAPLPPLTPAKIPQH
jgi:hypothetical protein